ARGRLTLERFVKLRHALIATEGAGEAVVDVALRAVGRKRVVSLRVPHFMIAPLVVAESDLVITIPERVVLAVGRARFAVHRPPVALPGFTFCSFWHERNDADAAHRWFREQVAAAAQAQRGS